MLVVMLRRRQTAVVDSRNNSLVDRRTDGPRRLRVGDFLAASRDAHKQLGTFADGAQSTPGGVRAVGKCAKLLVCIA